jgi:acyl-CoA thioester hydrolase
MIAAGFGIVARRYRIEYQQPALFGDELTVATWYSDARRSSAIRHYTITRPRDGALIARARAVWVWVDLASGRPIRIPDEFITAFAPNRALEPGKSEKTRVGERDS